MQFTTHTGEVITGTELQRALNQVAWFYETNAKAVRLEDPYADHVTEAQKDQNLADRFAYAESIRKGEIGDLSAWQKVNTALTGECVALLP